MTNGRAATRSVVAVDLGGTQIRVAVIDPSGTLVYRQATSTDAERGPEAVIERIKEGIRGALDAVGRNAVGAVGVAAPGPLDPWRGVVFNAPNLPGWVDVPLRDIVERAFNLPTHVGNDANLAAVGEHRYGAGRGVDDLVYMTVSTGIGGGVILGGRLLLGAHGGAAEIGHMTVDLNGPHCNCGNVGCLEALASGTAIARRAVALLAAGRPSSLQQLATAPSAADVTDAARRGDALAREILEEAGVVLGVGIVNLLHLFDPALVIIGGGVMQAGDLIWEPMRRIVETRAMPVYRRTFRLASPALDDNAGLFGAAALAFDLVSLTPSQRTSPS